MRRLATIIALVAALVSVVPAAAALEPIRKGRGAELDVPRLRAGTVRIPAGHSAGRVRVIVALPQPPLAASGRDLQSRSSRKLDVSSSSSRAYLARLDRLQRAASAELRREIPSARVSRRFRVVLNALTVEVPVRRLPQLVRLRFAHRVYPSVRYTLATNRSPEIIRAASFSAATGARGEGIKIAVVDDGVDNRNPFLAGAGFEFPAGFPRGGSEWTSQKVIVARAFPGPGSGRRGAQPVDRRVSFHGTHVAGIAAGNSGTCSPGGPDHPPTCGLSGVAPRAWIGNYRVFSVPTPIGVVANTPEIVAAFEAAVQDGMDVLNFSGGGPQIDPVNDAMIETVRNVAAAGVVPVISAGNDRQDFDFGTAGSPGTAPDAISVAATSNEHVFGSALEVLAPGAPTTIQSIPFVPALTPVPGAWETGPERLVDVGTIVGTYAAPVDRKLCAPDGNPSGPGSTLPPVSLAGAIALVSRGVCTFVSKAERARAAGAVGIVIVDNRPGEPNQIPIPLPIPGGMVSDLDGARLRDFMAATGGQTSIRIRSGPFEITTGRSGIITSFSSAGPTAFGHLLKPDVAAPGGHILSSTLPEFARSPFASFDGTSMSAPHVAGAAALLVQRHPTWAPHNVKSALVSTAGPAWGDTARTTEASVLLQGGGLVNVAAADNPLIFIEPVSLSLGDLNVNRGAAGSGRLVRFFDAGDGAGSWEVDVRPQAATAGASVKVTPAAALAPGGEAELNVVADARADAVAGDNYGFIVLRRGGDVRRIPYYFAVIRPGLESKPASPLRAFELGDTIEGTSHANEYRFPSWPFGPPPDYAGPGTNEQGAEDLFTTLIDEPIYNFGAAVWLSASGLVDPWLLGSANENDVQGYAGTPVNVNSLSINFRFDVGAAGAVFPRPKRYYVSVDSPRGGSGQYLLHSWRNDVFPPAVGLVTRRVSAGRPLIVVRVRDVGITPTMISGVDPTSLVLAYRRVLLGAAAYDPISGLAAFPLPRGAPPLRKGRTIAIVLAADFQEAKNVVTPGGTILPNTTFRPIVIRAVAGPTIAWLSPESRECVRQRVRLLVAAGSNRRVRHVQFFDGARRIATVRRSPSGLYAAGWATSRRDRGRHRLVAKVTDAAGRTARASRVVRVCR